MLHDIPGAVTVVIAVILAAYWDLLYRRIPNLLTIILLELWIMSTALAGIRYGIAPLVSSGLAFGVGCAAAVLVVGFALFCMRAVGAGDVKLAAVLCLWLGKDSFTFLLATSLAGGLLIMQLPLLRRVEMLAADVTMRLPRQKEKPFRSMPAILTKKGANGLPYGPAIAMGTIFTMLKTWA